MIRKAREARGNDSFSNWKGTAVKKTVSATEARVHFGRIMQNVEDTNDTVVVVRGGRPKVAIISMEQLEKLERLNGEDSTPHWKVLQRQVRDMIRQSGNAPLIPPPEDVIREMREERNARITHLS